MHIKYFTMILLALVSAVTLSGQALRINSNQSLPLRAGAGSDLTLVQGNSVTLGADPAASDGYGNYIYLWSPAASLDDPTVANPVASPSATTTYLLTVTDSHNCSVQDEVTVTVQSSGIESTAGNIDFRMYPNPVKGILTLVIKQVSGPVIFKIVNSTGMVVRQDTMDAGPFFLEKIDTGIYPTGNYFIVLISNETVITKPFIVL